jgi:ferritin-like protein
MGQSAGYHEDSDDLTPETKDYHRAIVSLMEELEAVDWYNQRVDAAKDEDLKAILAHNRDEEKEHAAMILEWIRRRDPQFAHELNTYLNTKGDITALEEHETND